MATGGTVSHLSAAVARGDLSERREGVVEILTTGRASSRPGIRVRFTSDLPARDVLPLRGVPMTSPTRTVLDLSQTTDRDTFLVVALNVLHRGAFDLPRYLAYDRRGRHGVSNLEALDEHLVEGTRSELERAMSHLCAAAQLPRPATQVRLAGHPADFAWPAQRLVVETDGWATHRSRAAFEKDRTLDARRTALGWRTLRFTHRQVLRQPELVVRALLAALEA